MTEDIPGPDLARIIHRYDTQFYTSRYQDFAEGWANFGYWEPSTGSLREACERLMEKLLTYLPDRKGSLLDVACGMGASTRYLTRYYPPDHLTGINVSERQLATCRQVVPGATFLRMDAARMAFGERKFDDVLCIEAAFHFDTREEFLREAFRVLKPGGRLVLSDLLMTRQGARRRAVCTERNHLENPEAYDALLRSIGFQGVEVVDVTEECWRRHYRHTVSYAHEKLLAREVDLGDLQRSLAAMYERVPDLEYYLLAAGRKPGRAPQIS